MNRFARPFTLLVLAALVALGYGALMPSRMATAATAPAPAGLAKAIFAGGCFWCMEPPFDKLDGVVSTVSGYTGGTKVDPTYEQVTHGNTGHTEAVEITYDPKKVSYERLLDTFWRNVDPTDKGGQFCDRGDSYRPEIFVLDDEQRRLAEASKAALVKSKPFKGEIVVPVTKAGPFYAAEDYHQDYYKKNPIRYSYYRHGCGRDARLETLWGKSSK